MNKEKPLILIVDDNPQNIQFLAGVLTERGYELGMAQNGTKAIEFVKDRAPDLILLDIMMPGMDGYEVCERLKNDLNVKHIPVIFLSAKSETEDIVKGFEVGGVDYVTKPFVSVELLARVKTHLEIKTLRSLLSICASCKKIRDKDGNWSQIEVYVEKHTGTLFSHGICEECAEKLYGQEKWFLKMKST